MTAPLRSEGLDAGYHGRAVVRDFNLEVGRGEVVVLLGPNGAGKTTVLLTLAGLLAPCGGRITVNGWDATRAHASAVARRGVVLVPDDRSLFTTLTVVENLSLGRRKNGMSVDDVLAFFPALAARVKVAAGQLSGGEQQMLAIGRAMIQQPKVLLIDELSMGLAPVIVAELLPRVREIATVAGAGIVLVEQHVGLALEIADRAVVLVHGATALSAPAHELAGDRSRLEHAYLGA
jgi:branched-chain amino acid transport system ATP-binding protein